LNETKKKNGAERRRAEMGKRMDFPKGIVAQSAEATKKATRHNATIGMAYEQGKPMILPSVQALTAPFSPSESVAYAPVTGVEELRQLWKKELLRKNPSLKEDHISLPMVVPGLTPGISTAADLFVEKDDVVIIPDMFWDNYELIFKDRNQAQIVTYPFFQFPGHLQPGRFKERDTEPYIQRESSTPSKLPQQPGRILSHRTGSETTGRGGVPVCRGRAFYPHYFRRCLLWPFL